MIHRRTGERQWWQQQVKCCSRCGSVDVRYRKTDKLCVCGRCGRESSDTLLSTSENRPLIRVLRVAWRGTGR